MKAIIICGSYPPDKCGVGEYSYQVVRHLNRNDALNVEVITSNQIINKNSKIELQNKKWTIRSIKYYYNLINNLHPDMINMQFPTQAYRKSIGIILIYMLLSLRNNTILTLHEFSDSPLVAKLRSLLLVMFSKKVIVVDRRYKESIGKFSKRLTKKITYIPISSMIPQSMMIDDKEAAAALKNKIKANEQEKLILGYFGFVNRSKGLETLIEVGAKLKEAGVDFILLFICELNDNNTYHKKIISLIEENHIQDYVKVTGYMDSTDVADYISICDCMIFPFINGVSSKNSSFLAAELQGVPVVTTKQSNADLDITQINSNVFLVDKYNDTDHIVEIVRNKKQLTKLLKSEIKANDWDSVSKLVLESYKEICDN